MAASEGSGPSGRRPDGGPADRGPSVGDRLDRELRRMAVLHRRSLAAGRQRAAREALLRAAVGRF